MKENRALRYIICAVLTAPTILLFAAAAFAIVTGWIIELPPFVRGTVSVLMLLSLPTSLALAFVFPAVKGWKIASAINAVPLILGILWGLFFWVVGIDS